MIDSVELKHEDVIGGVVYGPIILKIGGFDKKTEEWYSEPQAKEIAELIRAKYLGVC